MKALYAPFVLLLVSMMAACGSNQKEVKEQTATTDTVAVYDSVLTPNFYKRLEGTIADQPVVVHLQSSNGEISGVYYYLSHGEWLNLSGKLNTAEPNKVTLIETSPGDGEKSGEMDCSYAQGSFKGSWRSADGSKNYIIDLKETYPEGSYTFTTLSFKDSIPAFPDRPESPQAEVSSRFVVPLKDDADGQWLESQIKNVLHVDTVLLSLDLATAVKKMNGKYLKSYKDEAKNMGNDEQFTSFLNYEEWQTVSVCYNENGYVVLSADVYSYSGGAHGNGGTAFSCLDVRNKKQLKLQDVITADSARLQPIVEAAFRKQQGLRPSDSLNTILFENHLATTDNYYFTNKGIGFYYFPYEVAAYAVGPIQVFVTFAELKSYLKADFASRLKLQ